MRKPEFASVNEDFRIKRNAESSLLARPHFYFHELKKGKMKNLSVLACVFAAGALLMTEAAQAQPAGPNTKLRPEKTVLLYQETPVCISDPVQGKTVEALGLDMAVENGLSGKESMNDAGNIGNISDLARFDLYFPKKPNGQMIVVCPGGGYSIVSSYNEGVYVADWMLSRGITVAVVKYRLPNGHWTVPLDDVQNVFRYCREHASEWGVSQIGVMGFSAGGHLAASATTLYTDAITRPDFSILVYPVIALDSTPSHRGTRLNLIGNDEIWTSTGGKSADKWIADQKLHTELIEKYTLSNNITPDTPPVFLAHCTDDTTVPVINSIKFYDKATDNGVSAEMHIYPAGGHGWGFSSSKFVKNDKFGYARDEFYASLSRWLASRL